MKISDVLLLKSAAGVAYGNGQLFYDADNDCLTFHNSESEISLQIGQENYLRVRNTSGSTIANGAVVYVSGLDLTTVLPLVSLAKADALATAGAVGLATHAIENNTNGFVTINGLIHGIDTSGLSALADVYVSAATAGALTTTQPATPNYRTRVGICLRSHATLGMILLNQPTVAQGAALYLTSITSSSTPTPVVEGHNNQFNVTAAAANMTFAAPTGTAIDGQLLFIRIKGDATPRTIAHNSIYVVNGVTAMLTTTVASKTVSELFRYDAAATKYVLLGVDPLGY